jgi:O-antigen/teichoic acid export membrane protein
MGKVTVLEVFLAGMVVACLHTPSCGYYLVGQNSKLKFNLSNTGLAFAIPVLIELMNLLRSVYLANSLVPVEMGKALILLLILRIAEASSNISGNILLLQAPDGDSIRLQQNLQGFAIIRGFITSAILIFFGGLYFQSTVDSPVFSTLVILALVPCIQGFVHLDYKRRERNLNFRTSALVDLGGTFTGLISAFIFVEFIPQHTVVIAIVASYAVSWLTLSHIVARRRYRCRFEVSFMKRILAFGLPLLLSGIIGMLIMQGDKILVASYLSWEDVARYCIAAHIALTPLFIFVRAGQSLTMPVFREAIETGSLGQKISTITALYLAVGVMFFVGFTFLYNSVVGFVYGSDYTIETGLCSAFALLAALRIIRLPISLSSVALAKTNHALYVAIPQALGLIGGWYWLQLNPTAIVLVLAAIIAEIFSLILNVLLVKNKGALSLPIVTNIRASEPRSSR